MQIVNEHLSKYPYYPLIRKRIQTEYKISFFQSKPDDKELDPTYTPTPSEKKQKKFDDNETLMHLAVS